jgi:hypothetical protein
MLLIGDSGSGKTGALAPLARDGYRLRILDLDSGLDVLANLLKDPASPYGKDALSNVIYETVTDPMKNVNGKLIPAKATVWQRAMTLLDHWKVTHKEPGPEKDGKPTLVDVVDYDLGPVSSWGPQDVLVIDSLTMLSTAALNFVLSMNARLGGRVEQSDWYGGQQLIESLLQKLYDENIKCNVILISHIAYIGEDNGPQQGYPSSLGKALSPKIGRYFNTCVMCKTAGSGANLKRKLLTNSTNLVELKTSSPLKVKPEYELQFGLSQLFKDLRVGV